jgi:hypothetical protein
MQATGNAARPGALLSTDDTNGFRPRWDSIQTGFVDQPREAVEQADALVAEVMKRLAQTFADERAKLENAWSRGDNVSTEDLRMALQRYRSFFDRLVSSPEQQERPGGRPVSLVVQAMSLAQPLQEQRCKAQKDADADDILEGRFERAGGEGGIEPQAL